jgi:hypothetical protein
LNTPLLELQGFLRDKGIMICFSGRLSQELIEEYGAAVKKYMETEDRPMNEIFNIFSIFIEQTQNIKNYCSSIAEDACFELVHQSSIITIGKTEQGSYISSGNYIKNEHVEKLTQRVEKLIPLDKTALKKLYKDQLREAPEDSSQGAGIGLIEMARKATVPLQFTVSPVDEQLSFFTLKAIV